MKISSKNNDLCKLADDVSVMIFVAERMIADKSYMLAWSNKNVIYQRLNDSSEKMRIANEKIIRESIRKIWLIELRFVVSTQESIW